MKSLFLSMSAILLLTQAAWAQGNIGIGTSAPKATLHVNQTSTNNGNVLFTGPTNVFSTTGAVIANNDPGFKFLWIANRGSLRGGILVDSEWHQDSIGNYSIAYGLNVNASGPGSAVFGNGNRAGFYGMAAGDKNLALGDNAIAFGSSNSVSARGGAMSVGNGNIVKSYSATVVGSYNDTTGMAYTPFLTSGNPIFVVGNGTAHNARSNALTVMNNNRVGIGTPVPQSSLHIKSNSNIGFPQLLLEENENEYARFKMKNTYSSAYWDLAGYASTSAASTKFNLYYHNGTSGGDRLSLSGNGNLWIAGTLTQASDERLKQNISPLQHSLDKIVQVHGYHYQWKDPSRDSAIQTGLLAQEVENIFPELVITQADGIKSVNYIGLIPHLLTALQEQQKKITALELSISGK